jgi:hypothetical protein
MKKSDLIIKLSYELEKAQVALSSAAEAIEKYEGDNLDDQTFDDAAGRGAWTCGLCGTEIKADK